MAGKPIEVSRKVRRELDVLREAKVTGEVTIDGRPKFAWEGSLVNEATYRSLVEAGAARR